MKLDHSKAYTIGELYRPAMEITDQAEATAYFAELVAYHHARWKNEADYDPRKVEGVQKRNLGYFAGYYSHEVRERVERLFNCAHPVFGSIAKEGAPTTKQAFKLGKKLAKQKR
jgi:hypothetical protein